MRTRHNARDPRSGLALILVLTVIMALAVIATPFVLSMIMQEKTAVSERARKQAGYGAEGIRNFAVYHLYRGAEFYERQNLEKGKDAATPYADDAAEFVVEIRDARLKDDLKVLNPLGNLWGVTASDEQGKINVTTAPDRIVVNLRANLSHRVIDLKDILTIYSGRPARWVRPQKIREIGTIANPLNPTGSRISGARVDNAMQMGMAVKLRATKPGLPPFETKVTRNAIYLIGVHAIETDPPIPARYLHGLLEIEMRHPVNLNTARRETLAAVFDGLSISVPTGGGAAYKTYTFSTEDARRAADSLYRKNLTTWDQYLLAALSADLPNDLAKAAVIINALDPGNVLLNDGAEGRGTVPFCFSSNETVTIEAIASVNNSAGTPQGGAGFREVVDLGCPAILTRSWENQFDFDRMMGPPRLRVSLTGVFPVLSSDVASALQFAGILGSGYSGYPFGGRMETFPKDIDKGEPSDMALKSQQPKEGLNFISMRTEKDFRGQGGLFRRIDHFDTEIEGKELLNPHLMPHGEVFAPQLQRADVAAGGTEFWIRFDQPGVSSQPIRLFDIRETDVENRVSIEIILNEIVYRITDSTADSSIVPLDKGWSEIRAPFMPERDTWYHIAAYWKGTKYGQMILMIDGFVPDKAKWRHVESEQDRAMSTELSSAMAMTDPNSPISSVPLKDSTFLQRPANWPREELFTIPLQIGDEVVEYDPVRGEGRRSARVDDIVYGPKMQDHPANAKVTVFGYTSLFRAWNVGILYAPTELSPIPGELWMRFGPLVQTRGKTSLRFGQPNFTSVVGEDTDPDGQPVLSAQNLRIRYVIPDQAESDNFDWPDMGYLKIEDEAIFYGAITREGPKTGYFEQCTRGVELTLPVDHGTGTAIELWSIAVDSLDSRMSLPTIIQLNGEWFGPVNHPQTPVPAPQSFWVGCLVNGRPVSILRGWNWMIMPIDHEPEESVIPLFAAREVDAQRLRTNLGRYDGVTAINSNYEKEPHVVCRAITIEELNQWKYIQNPMGGTPPPPPRLIENQGVQLAAMSRQSRYDYPTDGVFSRIVKWPSGELLDQRWLANNSPAAGYGPAKAKIDELKNLASLKGEFLLDRVAPPEIPQLQLTNPLLLASNNLVSGVVVAGEEIIGFAEYRGNGQFIRCKRGWLNSAKEVHNQGDPVFILNFLPVAALSDQGISAEDRLLNTTQALAGIGYDHGYVLVDEEVIGFEEVGLKGIELDSLSTFEGNGLFRGMFGTVASAHQAHAMVFGIPFRYWDGYKRGQFDNRMPYFQAAHTTRDARWWEMRHSIEVGQDDPNLQPHAYVRIDGLGDFTVPGVDDHSAVWHFFKDRTNPLEKYISSRLENGQIEVRFFLEYKPTSYWPQHSWKRTMKVHELRIDYDRDTKVLFHEDK